MSSLGPSAPTLDDLVELATSPATLLAAAWASGYVVRHTFAPAWAQDVLALALVVAPLAGVVLLARALGLSLERGRCRARTNAGERCTRRADGLEADLCWQHQGVTEVELVDVDEDGADGFSRES